MFLQKHPIETINIPHGYRLVYENEGIVKEAIILDPKPNFAYYNNLLLRQLSNGTINQSEYDLRLNNDFEDRTVSIISDLEVSNEVLSDLLEDQQLDELIGDTVVTTIQNINSQGIQIIY